MRYQKINTLFKRDSNNHIILNEFTLPEFYYLKDNKWECTEKIDGTNIRIELTPDENGNFTIAYKGRTDNAEIPKHLYKKLQELFPLEKVVSTFINTTKSPVPITIFGEGYGVKIQKGGNYISNDVNFILFDVQVGKWWLERHSLYEIANKLDIDIVPFMGYMTIPEAIEFVKKGFKSTIAENEDYDAEGLVLKTLNGLLARNGERLITKIKTKDFRQLGL